MFCNNCGTKLPDDARHCPNCGKEIGASIKSTKVNDEKKMRCLPSFILGLIGSIFGMMGGFCTTLCSFGSSSNNAFFFIFVGSVVGLIGACLCLSKAKVGSVLETVAALMIIYRAYFKGGSDLMTVFALLLLLFGGIIGLVYSFIIKRKSSK